MSNSKSDFSADALFSFLDLAAQKGWLPKSTVYVMRSNATRVLSVLDADEATDISELDIESAVRRFANKNPQVSPQSLRDYRSRVERAISLFVAHRKDPLSVRAQSPRAGRPREPQSRTQLEEAPGRARPVGTSNRGGIARASANLDHGLSHQYPLRADTTVQIANLPRDLKMVEAERLAAFLRSLAEDYKP